jgi:hypothetical protein
MQQFGRFRRIADMAGHAAGFVRSKMTDAVEKGFSVLERRRIFHERLPIENIDAGILHLGFYYCPSWMVHRSLIDFFNSIDLLRNSVVHRSSRE